MSQDYAVKISVRNGRILRRIREAGFSSQVEFANRFGINAQQLNNLICMRSAAYNAAGQWRQIAWDISSALKCEPEDLFNEQQRQRRLERNSAEVFMDAEQVQQIMASSPEAQSWAKLEIDKMVSSLTNERHKRVILGRMNGLTCDELGEEMGLGKYRIWQMERAAMRQMKTSLRISNAIVARKIVLGDAA